MTALRAVILLACFLVGASPTDGAASRVIASVPEGGSHPQVIVGSDKIVHLIYLTGKTTAADVNYIRSSDGGVTWSNGATFSPERIIYDRSTGACGCCGMRLFANTNPVQCLYRGAADRTQRGLFLVTSLNRGQSWEGSKFAPMDLDVCLMSTAAFAAGGADTFVTWKALGQIAWGQTSPSVANSVEHVIDATGEGKAQKNPALAVLPTKNVVYDSNGTPDLALRGGSDGIPAHSLPAAYCDQHGDFINLY